MSVRPGVLLPVLALAACASPPEVKPPVLHSFESRPPKPPDCAFDVFEDRSPPRPYTVLGTLPVETNEWLGEKGRKALLRETACGAGADAVLLQRPEERAMARLRVRQHTALFIVYSDVAPAPPPPPPAPPPGDGYFVPIDEALMGDTEGLRRGQPPDAGSPASR